MLLRISYFKFFSANIRPCGQVKAKKPKISEYRKWEITHKVEIMPNFKIGTFYDLTKIFLWLSTLK